LGDAVHREIAEQGKRVYLTGYAGGSRIAPAVRYSCVYVWVGPENPDDFMNMAGCKEVSFGTNVSIYVAEDEEILNGVRIVLSETG